MEKNNLGNPHARLGRRLKHLREQAKKSVDEVAGAVEVESNHILQIEAGTARPSEDVLLLLMNHFDVPEDEAESLWELAGYHQSDDSTDQQTADQRQVMMVVPMDVRVVYTDSAQVQANDDGVVLTFMQQAGQNGKPLAISRVGMSHSQALKLRNALNRTIEHHAQAASKSKGVRQLPSRSSSQPKTEK